VRRRDRTGLRGPLRGRVKRKGRPEAVALFVPTLSSFPFHLINYERRPTYSALSRRHITHLRPGHGAKHRTKASSGPVSGRLANAHACARAAPSAPLTTARPGRLRGVAMGQENGSSTEGRQARNWLERIGQIFQGEPRDKDELIELLQDARKRGLLDTDALSMIEGVLAVADMQVRDIMIPRSRMVVVDREADLESFLPVIIESAHSRFPVIGENRDEVVGLLLAKDLLPFVAQGGSGFNIREVLRPAVFVPESKRLNVLLREFRASRNHMAIVVDEYGGVAGLVTIEDVIEQIVGEIVDEHDIEEEEHAILPAGDGCYTVRALTPISQFNDHFGARFPDDEFDTIGGLVLNGFGRMPKRGEALDMAGFLFTVLRADSRRVYLLEVRPSDGEPEESSAGEVDTNR